MQHVLERRPQRLKHFLETSLSSACGARVPFALGESEYGDAALAPPFPLGDLAEVDGLVGGCRAEDGLLRVEVDLVDGARVPCETRREGESA